MTWKAYDDLFNVSMTKAEQSAADEVWKYIQNNSIGLAVLNNPSNTKTNLTVEEILILEKNKNKNKHSNKKESYIVSIRGSVPTLEIDQSDSSILGQKVHRVYSPDGKETWVPTFQIACNPSVHFSSVIGNETFTSRNILAEASKAMCKQLDFEVHRLLLSVFNDNKKHVSYEEISSYLNCGWGFDNIIVSRKMIGDERICWEKEITDDELLCKNIGYTKNSKIPVHFIESDLESILFIPKKCGDIIVDHVPYVIKNRDALKLKINLVIFMSIGLVAYEEALGFVYNFPN